MKYTCPQCGNKLEEINYPSNSFLNKEQWNSQRAGDYFCPECPKSKFPYYWKKELEKILFGEQLSLNL